MLTDEEAVDKFGHIIRLNLHDAVHWSADWRQKVDDNSAYAFPYDTPILHVNTVKPL